MMDFGPGVFLGPGVFFWSDLGLVVYVLIVQNTCPQNGNKAASLLVGIPL